MNSSITQPSLHRVALSALRAPQWLHFCVLPLTGAPRQFRVWQGVESETTIPSMIQRLALAVCVSAGCLAFSYGINAVAERGTDQDAHKNPLTRRPEAARHAAVASVVAGLGAVVLASLLSSWALLAALASVTAGALYSVGLTAKDRPGLGLLFNAGIFAPLAALLLTPNAVPTAFGAEFAVFFGLLMQNQLLHEIADQDEDRAARSRTTAQTLGDLSTRRLIWVIAVAAAATGSWLAPSTAQAATASIVPFVAALTTTIPQDAGRARRYHRIIAMLGGGVLWLFAWA